MAESCKKSLSLLLKFDSGYALWRPCLAYESVRRAVKSFGLGPVMDDGDFTKVEPEPVFALMGYAVKDLTMSQIGWRSSIKLFIRTGRHEQLLQAYSGLTVGSNLKTDIFS